MTTANSMFHVTIDDAHRLFWLDGPGGLNAVRLHYEMVRHSREGGSKLRDNDIWALSQEEAAAQVQTFLPGYTFEGAWASTLQQSA
jgi:hypothetical protein